MEPTHSRQRGGFLQCHGAGRRCNRNVLTFHRTRFSQNDILPVFSSGAFFFVVVVPQLPAQH